ncbi:hypothetical protein D3C87_947750 [compost metagenome]
MNQLQFDFFGSVKEFNTLAGVTTDHFNPKQVGFYTGMQCEELAEKLQAVFSGQAHIPESMWHLIDAISHLGDRFKNNEFEAECAAADKEDLLDADIDLQVVSEGSILSQGADGAGARREVCRANMDKVVDGKLRRHPDTGKILKPEGWRAPDLTPFLFKG